MFKTLTTAEIGLKIIVFQFTRLSINNQQICPTQFISYLVEDLLAPCEVHYLIKVMEGFLSQCMVFIAIKGNKRLIHGINGGKHNSKYSHPASLGVGDRLRLRRSELA